MIGPENIVGQDQIKDFIKKSACMNKISHAYILCGEKGSGRYELARLFAATLQCSKEHDPWNLEAFDKPCGECRSCLQMESGNQPDVITLTHEKKTIGVDDIRDQVNNHVSIKPYAGPYKIYIIPEADKMTEQAQNALLKTIEEPPGYAIIILIVENIGALLSTILSRCVLLNLRPVSEKVIMDYLMDKLKLPDYAAETSAVFAQGNIGRAIRYATDEDFTVVKDEVIKALKNLDGKRVDELMDVVRRIKDENYNLDDYLDIILLWYRDILLYKAVKDPSPLLFRDDAAVIDAQARVRSYENLEKCIKAIDKAKQRLRANVNFEITMELLFITLKEIS